MKMHNLRGWLWCACLVLAGFMVAACSEPANESATTRDAPELLANVTTGDLMIEAPWARVAPAGGTSAVYLRIANGTAMADTLVGVASPMAATVELHESFVGEGGVRGMRPVNGLPIAAGATAPLQPGGFHIMLIRLRNALAEGDSVAVDLAFTQAGTRTIAVPVRTTAP